MLTSNNKINNTEKNERSGAISETKFRKIIENSKESYFEVDLKGNLIFFNDALSKALEYPPNELLGLNYRKFIDNEDLELVYNAYNKVFKSEDELDNFQYKVITKTGKVLFGENTIQLRYNSQGEKIGFRGFMRDITDQKIAEQKLKESEQKFRTIAEKSLLGIAIVQDNVVKYINKQFSTLIGYTIDEVKNWKAYEYKILIHPDHLKFVSEQLRKKQQGKKDGIKNRYAIKLIKKSGETLWVDNFSKTINYRGRPANLITIIDISKQKEAEELIKQENQRLKELDEMRKSFLDRASHELKTPLTSVYGASQLLTQICDNFNDNNLKDVRELLGMINEGTEKLISLVSNLLDISRIENGNYYLEKESFDLCALTSQCVADMKYLIQERDHEIKISLPENCNIDADKSKIERVIVNLLSNAIKYTPRGGLIRIEITKSKIFCIFSISDNGIGLSDNDINKVFDKFSNISKPSDEYDIKIEGTGLGLHITKEFIHMHDGGISVKSKGLNKGTTFTVKLPLKE
ncbi:MAG: PAS domain S-box protein [Candidatus Lokiarchaeota archaeon]|nr:PAS domain S-box protein [Candidatus Lokiarchaeota archaeon]MBD3198944.1 PAS domain S-box protein [Candidatus Lokiarchaeota archaeon]